MKRGLKVTAGSRELIAKDAAATRPLAEFLHSFLDKETALQFSMSRANWDLISSATGTVLTDARSRAMLRERIESRLFKPQLAKIVMSDNAQSVPGDSDNYATSTATVGYADELWTQNAVEIWKAKVLPALTSIGPPVAQNS